MKVLPTYPLTIAVVAKDNADPSTGLEYGTGSNLGMLGRGVPVDLLYAGPLTPANGVAQFNLPVPRSLIGASNVDIFVTINGKQSNAVSVNIK